MRLFLFNGIASAAKSIATFVQVAQGTIISIVSLVFGVIVAAIQWSSSSLLRLVDKDRYEYFYALAEQRNELNEFYLMAYAKQVCDEARQSKVWTYSHTAAIQQTAQKLHVYCGWEKNRVHAYLKSVVETLPGMTYFSGDDFDG